MSRIGVSIVFVCLFVTSAARADSRPFTHDGFMLRLSLGLGYENLSIDDGDGTTLDIGGVGGATELGIGGMVADNLAINGVLLGSTVVSPSVSQNGQDLGEADDSSVSLFGLGAGITYWLMPADVYFAAAILMSQASIKVEGTTFEADWGVGVDLMIGKEFWVGAEWGVGVAAQFAYADVPTQTSGSSANYLSFNVMFTATYN